jgi:hypothetical protein
MHDVLRDARQNPPTCPHCGKPLMQKPENRRWKRRYQGKGLLGS